MKILLGQKEFLAIASLRRQAGKLRTLVCCSEKERHGSLVHQFALQLIAIAIEIDEATNVVEEQLPQKAEKKKA